VDDARPRSCAARIAPIAVSDVIVSSAAPIASASATASRCASHVRPGARYTSGRAADAAISAAAATASSIVTLRVLTSAADGALPSPNHAAPSSQALAVSTMRPSVTVTEMSSQAQPQPRQVTAGKSRAAADGEPGG
jgi:hypothetical protein